jgi:hypothetical protein
VKKESMYKVFDSLDDLMREIVEELKINEKANRRYPARFIFSENMDQYRELVLALHKITNNYIDLSSLCNADVFPTKQDLFTNIEDLLSNPSSFIYPISEVLRFYQDSDFTSFFNYLMDSIENPPTINNRIYLPLYGIWTPFQNYVLQKFSRKHQWAPIWKLHAEYATISEIYRVTFPVTYGQKFITNAREWLSLWKNDYDSRYYSTSKNLNYLAKQFLPDEVFISSNEVSNYRDLIQSLFKVEIPFQYKEKDSEHWVNLFNTFVGLPNSIAQSDFDSVISKRFEYNLLDLGLKSFVKHFIRLTDTSDKWLLSNWYQSKCNNDETHENFRLCLESLSEYSDNELILSIWLSVFQHNASKQCLHDRYELLFYIHKGLAKPTVEFESQVSSILDKRVEYVESNPEVLTGILNCESLFVLKKLRQDASFIKSSVFRQKFTLLFEYLNWEEVDFTSKDRNAWIAAYFREYCMGKITWKRQAEVDNILNKVNSDANSLYDWYYKLQLPDYSSKQEEEIYWVDCLGAEWTPLLLHLIRELDEDNKWFIESVDIRRVYLPTITDVNRIPTPHHIQDLDKYIHSNQISNNMNQVLLGQISTLQSIVRQILASSCESIVISSDHGSSYLCIREFVDNKGLGMSDTEHGGRYKWLEDESDFASDQIKFLHVVEPPHMNNRKCLIALKHVSLGNRLPFESHGGATPEEILVPFIKLRRVKKQRLIVKPTCFLGVMANKPEIEITIQPKPSGTPYILLQEERFNMTFNEDHWECSFKGLTSGQYDATLVAEGQHYDIKITIKSGMIQEELF